MASEITIVHATNLVRSLIDDNPNEAYNLLTQDLKHRLGDSACVDILGRLVMPNEYELVNVRIEAIGDKFINAIKDLRSATGYGLKEAKDIIEGVRAGTPYDLELKLPKAKLLINSLRESGSHARLV